MARDGGVTASVIVATHERPQLLRGLLRSLAASDDARRAGEILVVENGPQTRSAAVVREFESMLPLRYVHIDSAGKSPALNYGLRAVEGDLAIFFDDDVTVDAGTISAYLAAAGRYGERHFFGGHVAPRYEGGTPPPDWLSDALPFSCTGFDLGGIERKHDEFLGANWAAFRGELLAVGGFSTWLGPEGLIGEETEIQARLVARGCTGMFLPGARVNHFVPQSHLSIAWARNRRYRQYVARALIEASRCSGASLKGPRIAGVPRYLWRSLAAHYLRVLRDRLLRPKSRERVRSEMRLAKLRAEVRAFRWRRSASAAAGPDCQTGRNGSDGQSGSRSGASDVQTETP